MAHHAVIRTAVVLARNNIGHLPPLWGSGDDTMAIGTAHTIVVAMGKNRSKNIPRLRRAIVWSKFVTSAARADLAFGSVAGVAIIVCTKSRRNCLSGSRTLMTRSTTRWWSSGSRIVVSVVKLHIEALVEFTLSLIHI